VRSTANPGFTGTDTFQYTIADKNGVVSDPATVTVAVGVPLANPDVAQIDGTKTVVVDVLANDTDPDGNDEIDPATVKVVGSPAHGSVAVDPATGAVTYTPADGFAGTDTFKYTMSDTPGAESNVATVTVRVGEAPLTVAGADAGGGPQVAVLAAKRRPRTSDAVSVPGPDATTPGIGRVVAAGSSLG
jgi:hypothetical protein